MSRDDGSEANSGGEAVNPAGGVPAPTEIGDDVRADLEAAFSRDATRLRIKDDPTIEDAAPAIPEDTVGLVMTREPQDSSSTTSTADQTGQIETPMKRSRFGRRRRSILEIARDYDSRIKAQAESKNVAVTKERRGESESSPLSQSEQDAVEPGSVSSVELVGDSDGERGDTTKPVKVTPDGKKRVVITDDTMDAARTAGERRRVSRRRFSLRTRSPEDDELSRLRKQRRAKQRAEGRWRPRWYVVVGSLGLVVVLVLLILTSPILSIKQVEIEGNVYADPDLLAAVIADLEGDPILTADLHGAQKRVEDIPWVRKARVSMRLPSTVVIQVDERAPLAFVRSTDGFNRVIDRDGRVLDVLAGDPTDYVRIIGTAPTLVAGDFVPQPFLGAAQLINALPVDLAARLVSATVSPEGEISLQFTPTLQVIFGAPSDYQAKLVGVINEIKRQGTKSYSVIDVSTGEPNVR